GRRPPSGGALRGEVGMILLARAGTVDDEHRGPGAFARRQPEPVRAVLVDPLLARGLRGRERSACHRLWIMTAAMETTTKANPVEGSAVYPLGSRVNERGHLEVSGCDVVELAAEFGTPAYVYAEDDMRARARAYKEAFAARTDNYEIVFASKAAPFTAAYRVFAEEGLSADVASGGELHMALRAGFPPERIHMHGNNKTEAELRYAVEAGVGHIILDSFDELRRL